FYAAASQVLAAGAARAGSGDAVRDRLQALAGYGDELRACGVPDLPLQELPAWWRAAISSWEQRVADFLPVRAVRDAAGIDPDDIVLVFAAGLIDEDARFGALFESLNDSPGQPRPTVGLLGEWRREANCPDVRAPLRLQADCGLVR